MTKRVTRCDRGLWLGIVTLALVMYACDCGTILKDDDGATSVDTGRVHEHKLSEQEHYTDADNDKKYEHNVDYDHDAFLGKEEADKFKAMSPEQSKEKLGQLVDKIDKNHDRFINENELRTWIRQQHKLHLQKTADKRWKELNTNKDDRLTIDELIENTIGKKETWSPEEIATRKDDYRTYLKLMERDKMRFKAADLDADGTLTKAEYADFLHPEESKRMRDVVVNETLEDLDKNKDGVVSLDEFIEDMYRGEAVKSGDEEPEWIKVEREHFRLYRDKNGDNVMDREEVANWILPADFDHTLNEAKHLIYEADENKDGKLTKEEILDKYTIFVSSQATAYGQAIYDKEDL